jgi:hypothetical protein
MKAQHLQLLLAIAVLPACSAAPLETPSETAPPIAPIGQSAEEIVAAGGIPAGYMIAPGGNRISQQCVTLLKAGEAAVRKTTPCPIAPIKAKTIKKTMPVEGGELVTAPPEGSLVAGEQNLAPTTPSYSFNVPQEWVAAMGSDYLLTTPNLGQKSQGNVTKFQSQFATPVGALSGDMGQLLIISTAAQKWGGVYPAFDGRFANVGVYLQQGWNGMWGSWQWTLYTYADDGYGNWTFNGPIFDVQQGTVLSTTGTSELASDPYWGSVTRWHINVNNTLFLDFDYPNPFDMNFVMSTMEFYNVAQSRNLFPSTTPLLFSTRFYGSQKGCVPGAGPGAGGEPLPWWMCGQAEFTPPKWRSIGNGGNMPDYRVTATPDTTGGTGSTTFYNFNILHK